MDCAQVRAPTPQSHHRDHDGEQSVLTSLNRGLYALCHVPCSFGRLARKGGRQARYRWAACGLGSGVWAVSCVWRDEGAIKGEILVSEETAWELVGGMLRRARGCGPRGRAHATPGDGGLSHVVSADGRAAGQVYQKTKIIAERYRS